MKVVPDEITAITMAKEGLLDIVSLKSSSTFLELRDNDADKFSFHTPQLMFFYYIALNNTAPFLQEKTRRRAIAHLIDINDIILTLDKGLGVRTTGPFHPTKPYYNKSLEEIKPDIKRSGELLDSNGWRDTDGDGIRDKLIKGIKTPLQLDFYISKNIALLFQESAAKGGVQLNIVSKANSLMQKENINVKKYDMAALAQSFDASSDDPYSNWHSDNAGIGGTNKTGYANPRSDALIEKIRTTRDVEIREELYMELQEVMYEDQPMIFMYSPLMKFIISNDIVATTTSKRPGYLANTFKKRKI
jgi:peptide/nickel transport system substrate-binding protein